MSPPLDRPPTDAERAQIAARVALLRQNLARAVRTWHHDAVFVTALGVVAALGMQLLVEGAARGVMAAIGLLIAAIGVRGWWVSRRLQRQRLEDFDRQNAPRLEAVQEWTLSPRRVLAASDTEDGPDWWLFELESGWLVLPDEGGGAADLGAQAWCERGRLVLDRLGVPLSYTGEGARVPVADLRLKPPDFVVGPQTALWTPPSDTEWLVSDADVRQGQWPAGTFPEAR